MSENGTQAQRASYSEGAGYGALSFLVMAAFGVVSAIVIARVYGIDTIGEYALVMAPTNAVWFLSSVRERAAFVRELATLEARAPRITALFWAMLGFSFALTLLVSALAGFAVDRLYSGPVDQPDLVLPALAYLASYLFVINTQWNVDAVLLGFRAGRELFWIRLHQTIVFFAVAVAYGLAIDSVWGLVVANLVSAMTALVHRCFALRPYMAAAASRGELRAGLRTLPELIKFGLKVVPGSLANGVRNEVATWALALQGSIVALGAYNRAKTLTHRLGEIDYRITGMLLPTMVERRAFADHAGFDRALVDTIRYASISMLLPAAVGAGCATGIMDVFGPGFAQGADALALLLLLPALVSVANIQRATLLAVDRPALTSVVAIVTMLVTVGATIPFVSALGITGAALGLVTGALVNVIWMTFSTRREMSAPFRDLWPLREAVALPLACAAGFWVARLIDSSLDAVLGVVPALLGGSVAYAVVFWLAGGVNRRDRARLEALRRRLAARRRGRRASAAPQAKPHSTYAS